jgi:hypothetical protein
MCLYFPSLLALFFFGGIDDLIQQGRMVKTLTFIKPSPELRKIKYPLLIQYIGREIFPEAT